MYTRCPKCSTCFRVTDRHLSLAKGKVRCGQCRLVFNAPENAIDDLPVHSKNNPANDKPASADIHTEVKKSAPATADKKTAQTTPVTKKEKIIKTPVRKKSTTKKTKNTKKHTPVLDADATMVADDTVTNKYKFNVMEPSTDKKNNIEIVDDDDLFDDSFDLDAAIDELTHANEDVLTANTESTTTASNVDDILNQVEAQLPLDISKMDNDKKIDANDEFEFIDELEEIESENENITEDTFKSIDEVNADELFDQVDLTDFQGSENNNTSNIPFQLRTDIERLQAPPQPRWHPLLSLSFLIILLIATSSQLAYFRSHELASLIPSSRPLLEKFCAAVSCHYSGPSDSKQIELLSRDVRLHPKEKKALLISAAIINNARFPQPYPDIHIRLSDISGNVVAERIFNAKTYMGKLSNPFLLMKSKTPVHINFEVVDPGRDAINFEFTFL
jgi:predicted Zn finger-like uncharacterized protein